MYPNIVEEQVHISKIAVGDTVRHNDEIKTVSGNNIRHDKFIGTSIFGDCYKSGHKLVTKIYFMTKIS